MKKEILEGAGNVQLCVRQDSGCEAAIHSMVDIFNKDDTEGLIQIDAENAFNSINRKVLLANLRIICPELEIFASNCYNKPARLFVVGGIEIPSAEGTTQDDPIAMPVYSLAMMPLLSLLNPESKQNKSFRQVAFADDLTGVDRLEELKMWWDKVVEIGPYMGYNAKPSKSLLVIKPEYESVAKNLFRGSGLQITSEGRKHLGAVVGSEIYKKEFVDEKMNTWVNEI